MRYKYLFIVVALLSVLDMYVTYNIVAYDYELEVNPVMREVLINHGYVGLAILKGSFIAILAFLLSLLKRKSDIVCVSLLICIGLYIGVIAPGLALLI
jgi:hypothetical protein